LVEPGQRPFGHPPPWEQYKAFPAVWTKGHTQNQPHMLGDPLDQLPTIGAMDPEQVQLFAGPTEPSEEEPGASRIRHRGGGDEHGHEQPQGIDQEVPFASFDLFSTVVATLPAQFRRLDALAVETASGGMFVATFLLAHLGAQGVVEALP